MNTQANSNLSEMCLPRITEYHKGDYYAEYVPADDGEITTPTGKHIPAEQATEDEKKNLMLFCGKCDHSRETTLYGEICGGFYGLSVNCQCEWDALEKERQRKRQEDEQRKLTEHKAKKHLHIPSQYHSFTFANSKPITTNGSYENFKSINIMHIFADKFEKIVKNDCRDDVPFKHGLYVYGSCGTGKTYYAAAVANKIYDKGFDVEFHTMTELVSMCRREYSQGFGLHVKPLLEPLGNGKGLLVIDDIGAEMNTNTALSFVFAIIDYVTTANIPLIVTSNIDRAELLRTNTDMDKQRVYSRLSALQPVRFEGTDRRGFHDENATAEYIRSLLSS